MEKKALGSLAVSAVGLGGNNFGARINEERSKEVINAALDAGIDFIDTAEAYGAGESEEILGRVLKGRRDAVVLTTKFGMSVGDHPGGAKPAVVRAALQRSLKRLQTEWVDLYMLHVPDPETPIEETLGVLNELRHEGLIREAGCSSFSLQQLEEANRVSSKVGCKFAAVQNEFSLLVRKDERELMPLCLKEGIGYIPYYPLAAGLLTGKYGAKGEFQSGMRMATMREAGRQRFLSESNLARAQALRACAEEAGLTLLELAMSWLVTRPAISSVIAGATSAEQVRINVAASQVTLDASLLAAIDRISPPSYGRVPLN